LRASAQPIAAVLADVDGTLVTRAKVVTARAIGATGKLHDRQVLLAITSGRPPRGMRMLVRPLKMRGPLAAINGGIIVQPDMTIAGERAIPAGAVLAVTGAMARVACTRGSTALPGGHVTDPDVPHAAREAGTVQFQPPAVPGYDGLLNRAVAIADVNDDHGASNGREWPGGAHRSW
jgi:hypothetical protein